METFNSIMIYFYKNTGLDAVVSITVSLVVLGIGLLVILKTMKRR